MDASIKSSVVALRNVPAPWPPHIVAKLLKARLQPNFYIFAMELDQSRKKKIAYVKLASVQDSADAVRKIKHLPHDTGMLHGFIPHKLPRTVLSKYQQLVGCRPPSESPERVFVRTLRELVIELQYKYVGLYELSGTAGHALLETLASVVCDRLLTLKPRPGKLTCISLSQAYRMAHPHSRDFKLVLSTLHKIEDERKLKRTEATEKGWEAVSIGHPFITDEAMKECLKVRAKYIDTITQKVTRHMESLNADLPRETKEQRATIKVRRELRRLAPYFSRFANEGLPEKSMAPPESFKKDVSIRVYGEPSLPRLDACVRFLHEYGAYRVGRLPRVYNCLVATIPFAQYARLMKLNGLARGASKLLFRPSRKGSLYIVSYKNCAQILNRIRAEYREENDSDYEILDSDLEAELNK